ncbi:uncharacterized protein RSE6_02223 [Rhynchosporium secalis]|uniref:Uncharacterized protein n=1 Tax=Rhynchosporium secalis TaxID=38038 RepID=A0A1E1M1C3_RHYSE|nr:uncharacterized protein RSE6_02223 [Rhynchosporium secalis]
MPPPPRAHQTPQAKWLYAAVEDENNDGSETGPSLRAPLPATPAQDFRPKAISVPDADEALPAKLRDMGYYPFDERIMQDIMDASITDMEILCKTSPPSRTLPIEAATKEVLGANSLKDLALVRKKSFVDLNKHYRQLLDEAEGY